MNDLLDLLSEEERSSLVRRGQPRWMSPMRATLVHEYFSDPDWIFEPKLDGERCLVFRRKSDVALMSRNQKRINLSYPEIVDAVGGQAIDRFIVDGEIVAFADDAPSFARLQRRMHVQNADQARRTGVAVFFYAFDILYVGEHLTTELPLRSRKKLLRKALDFVGPLRFVTHRNEAGEEYLAEICEKPGWEGLIAKRADATYRHAHSKDWLKFKCARGQEFVIGGYTDPLGSRTNFGALLIGYYDDDGRLRYAGKVGTGFDQETLRRLGARLERMKRKSSPFAIGRPPTRRTHWVTPDLVAEIGFAEWTGDGRLRHPRFLGLRRDKDPKKVVREP